MNTLNPCSGLNPNGTGPLNVKKLLINPPPRKRLGSIDKFPHHNLRGWNVRPASSHTQRTRPCRTTASIDRTHRVGRTIASRRARLTTIVTRGAGATALRSFDAETSAVGATAEAEGATDCTSAGRIGA
jgi:hypothetical protein